jgi:RNA polymerase sigma-70 factor (ECF subfamily)
MNQAVAVDYAAPSDEVLIAAVLGGDTERFALLVVRYQARVMRFILKYEYNAHDAQDLAQETFLQAFRGLSSFQAQARFSTWITGIAFNLLKNHISRNPSKRYVHLDIAEQIETEGRAASDNPAQAYEHHQLLQAMECAIVALAPDLREALVLVVSEGMSYEEAAAVLELPIGTLKSRLCRARVQLAAKLRAFRGD